MKRFETREQIKTMVMGYEEGISLTELHNKVHREVTRLQLRTLLGSLYMKGEITRERVKEHNRRETKYFPFSGKPPVTRKKKPAQENDSNMLTMKDFMPGKKYQAYIDF
jgi:hypothetical protein